VIDLMSNRSNAPKDWNAGCGSWLLTSIGPVEAGIDGQEQVNFSGLNKQCCINYNNLTLHPRALVPRLAAR
jgi:hypothetical protein